MVGVGSLGEDAQLGEGQSGGARAREPRRRRAATLGLTICLETWRWLWLSVPRQPSSCRRSMRMMA
jgi:hypothetical protein